MADYISTLTGPQMDASLLDMAEHNSEAYAVGERNGNPVDQDDVTYHNNAKYYAQIATSTVSPGDIGDAVRWNTDQTAVLSDAEKGQARANINATTYNKNLFDNSRFIVNQRGSDSYTASSNMYTFDRWKKYSSTTISKSGDVVTIAASGHINIFQPISTDMANSLLGKTITVSAMDSSGTITTLTGVVPSSLTTDSAIGEFTISGQTVRFLIVSSNTSAGISGPTLWFYGNNSNVSISIKALKLEIGTSSTLAYDPYPAYWEEFYRCIYSKADPADPYANQRTPSYTNPNLLDNPWFTVSQRGVAAGTSVNANGFVVDRWQATGTTGATLNANGTITVTNTLFHKLGDRGLAGKTVTLSVLFADDTIESKSFTWSGTTTQNLDSINCTVYAATNQMNFSGGQKAVKAVKLELGSVSTLANDTPPDYGTELLKCQRYFFRLKMESNRCYAVGFAESTTSVRIALPVPSPMRTDPTVTTSGTIRFKGNGGILTPSAFATSNSYPPDATARINCTVSGATQYQLYALSANDSSTYIDLSADL